MTWPWFRKKREREKNEWRGVTISLREGGQGHPTPIHTHNPTPYTFIYTQEVSKSLIFPLVTRSPLRTDGWMDGRTWRVTCPQLKKDSNRDIPSGLKRGLFFFNQQKKMSARDDSSVKTNEESVRALKSQNSPEPSLLQAKLRSLIQ